LSFSAFVYHCALIVCGDLEENVVLEIPISASKGSLFFLEISTSTYLFILRKPSKGAS
jgi:hypothetical protein